jgi:hypothetical protein
MTLNGCKKICELALLEDQQKVELVFSEIHQLQYVGML